MIDLLNTKTKDNEDGFDEEFYPWLINRVGESYLRERLDVQMKHATKLFGRGRTLFHIENVEWLMVLVYYILKLTGMYNWGHRNFLDIQIEHNEVEIKNLPRPFHNYTILQISDLHLDLAPELIDIIIDRINQVDYDVCVITGDYRASTGGNYRQALDLTAELMTHIKKPLYAILGNHDFIEFLPKLEREAGMTFLINESIPLEKEGATIYLSGIDDPHLYQLVDFPQTLADVPTDAVKILLAHAPEAYQQAADYQYDLMLSGHTHGGQICLPGGIPILAHLGGAPRRMAAGRWSHGRLQGYTSRGTGGGGVPVRFFCPPEITLHTLQTPQPLA